MCLGKLECTLACNGVAGGEATYSVDNTLALGIARELGSLTTGRGGRGGQDLVDFDGHLVFSDSVGYCFVGGLGGAKVSDRRVGVYLL